MAKTLYSAIATEFDDKYTLADPASIDAITKERTFDKFIVRKYLIY